MRFNPHVQPFVPRLRNSTVHDVPYLVDHSDPLRPRFSPVLSTIVSSGAMSDTSPDNDNENPRSNQPAAGTPLYGHSIWSPNPNEISVNITHTPGVTTSATLPPKPTWEQLMADHNRVTDRVADTTNAYYKGNKNAQHGALGSLVGLGMNISATDPSVESGIHTHAQAIGSNIDASSTMRAKTPKDKAGTFPLVQYPFGTARETADQPRPLSKRAQRELAEKVNDEDHVIPHGQDDDKSTTSLLSLDDDSSVAWSDVTVPHGEYELVKQGCRADAWKQRDCHKSFRYSVSDDAIQMHETYPGAMDALGPLNPAIFVMPFGSKVICIKMEALQDMFFGIRNQQWSNNPKVNDRVQKVWEQKDENDHVYFLFSHNGSGQYCALAQMTGPVDREFTLEGWKGNAEGNKCQGNTPLRFHFVKSVKFANFSNIVQPRNGHAISNMWNGMHFPTEIAREVVKVYVESPHIENILVKSAPLNGEPYSNEMFEQSPLQKTRGVHRGGRGSSFRGRTTARAGRGGARGAYSNRPDPGIVAREWRRPEDQTSGENYGLDDNDKFGHVANKPTPLAFDRPHVHRKGSNAAVPPSPIASSGTIVMALMGPDGTLSPIDQTVQSSMGTPTYSNFPQLDGHSPMSDVFSGDQGSNTSIAGYTAALPSAPGFIVGKDSHHAAARSSHSHDNLRGARGGYGFARGGLSGARSFRHQKSSLGTVTPPGPATAYQWSEPRPHGMPMPTYPSMPSHMASPPNFTLQPISAPPRPFNMSFPPASTPGTLAGPGNLSGAGIDPTATSSFLYTPPLRGKVATESGTQQAHYTTHKLYGEPTPNPPSLRFEQFSNRAVDRDNISRGLVPAIGTQDPAEVFAPMARRGHHARGSEFTKSFDARIQTNVDALVGSPDISDDCSQKRSDPLRSSGKTVHRTPGADHRTSQTTRDTPSPGLGSRATPSAFLSLGEAVAYDTASPSATDDLDATGGVPLGK